MTAASEATPVVIIGAGPAGLAAAECLQKRRIKHVVLEAGPKIASALRRVDPEMRLLSPTSLSLLPDMQRRVDEPNYLPFNDLVQELELYAKQHGLEVINGATVVSVEKSGEDFSITYQINHGVRKEIVASHVINASGIISHPQLPGGFDPEQVSFQWLHSLNTRAGDLAKSRKLLVVGGGASAAEVLERWLEVRKPDDLAWLSVRSRLRAFPHWILGVDIHYFVWLPEQLPARLLGWRAGRLHEPMTGLKVKRALDRKIITRVAGVARYESNSVVLADGSSVQPDLVVFATGFRYETRHLEGLLEFDPEGRPVVRNCESTRTPGLFLLGFRFGRTLASPYLRGIARDAEYVARRIEQARKNCQRRAA
jgi:putative flavoprotein involved in K+ transport